MNEKQRINDCRDLSRRWGCDQVVVIAIDSIEGTFQTVSYGATRELCARARVLNDSIHEMVADGTLPTD